MSDPGNHWSRLLSLTIHELRTPLTVLAGYLRMLLRNQNDPLSDAQRRLLQEAEKACGRLSGLVGDLSDLLRMDQGEAPFNRGPVAFGRLLREAAAACEAQVPSRSAVEVRGADQDKSIMGDATRLCEALVSILHATARETLDEQRVVITGEHQILDGAGYGRILIGAEPTVRELASTPVDGLLPFDEWRGGSGLDLPLARRVIEAHGGRVWSPPGEPVPPGAVVILPFTVATGEA